MGSPVSAVIANLYIKDFEEQALSFTPTAPKDLDNVMLTTLLLS